MVFKAKSTGRKADDSVGLFDSRLRKAQASGLTRGTASVSSGKTGNVNKQKYALNSRGNLGYK